jgi:hypothetical protein
MAISSQILEEILPITEAFKAQLYDTLHDLVDGLNDSFRSIQDSLDNMQEIFLMVDIRDEYNQEIYFWYVLRPIVMIGIWIVFISGMTTISIFYLMILLHLL